MQKSVKRVAFAVTTRPFTLKLCALYAFRPLRRLGDVAEQTPNRMRDLVHDVHEAWAESRQEAKR